MINLKKLSKLHESQIKFLYTKTAVFVQKVEKPNK